MSHLGSRVAPLVDGQLPAGEAEELLAHAAVCARCHWLLGQERASRTMLSQAWDVEPDPELTARLLALSPGPEDAPGGMRTRRVLLGVAGAGGLAAACAVGLVVVGGVSEPLADPHAILEVVTGAVGERPAELTDGDTSEVVAWMTEQGWSAPESLPSGMRVVDVAVHETEAGEVLEVEIAGAMAHVRLLQQRGVLPGEAAEQLQADLVGRHDALLMPSGVHDHALQSEGCVVVVLAAADDAPVSDAILAALPEGDYDTSVAARFSRGWETVTQWTRD